MKCLSALALLTLSGTVAAQQPTKTFYLDYAFQEIFVNNDVAYIVDRYATAPVHWTDSVFTVAGGDLRQVVQTSRQSQGDTLVRTTQWQANGRLQWQEEKRGKHLHGPQLYYNEAGQLRHRHLYVAGALRSTECVPVASTSRTCQEVEITLPQYPGGQEGILRYIAERLHYPADALSGRKQGKVLVYFVIDETGQVRNVHVKDSIFPSLSAESIRVVKGLPRFGPGRKAGLPVPVRCAVPVTFNIN
ncbi:energy transducer TonB [Hymenobacter sublimis]|uniref:Energy transducer TonB n=1 Tax=Hymenobacter sublimis TaxID=2933777 RepID=A0ABY4JDS9_9BACT|nr:energy transducer TonB [Hymenobacter sublimis]UPL50993.1 energy transducer TonB [Hymenobacter sublimis]